MNVLYEDSDLIVAVKPPELSSENEPGGDGFADLLAARNGGYVGVIHRLDRGVGGVMVYAKTPDAAATLSRDLAGRRLQKEYLAAVRGTVSPDTGEWRDLLFHDRRQNKTFVADRMRAGVKEAILNYRTEATASDPDGNPLTLLRIELVTGRTHQIRVQAASRGFPLIGDRKYGSRDRSPILLFCTRLSFPHPVTGKTLVFSALPEAPEWHRFFPTPQI